MADRKRLIITTRIGAGIYPLAAVTRLLPPRWFRFVVVMRPGRRRRRKHSAWLIGCGSSIIPCSGQLSLLFRAVERSGSTLRGRRSSGSVL